MIQLSNEITLVVSGILGDYTTQCNGDYLEDRRHIITVGCLLNNPDLMESKSFFFVAQFP